MNKTSANVWMDVWMDGCQCVFGGNYIRILYACLHDLACSTWKEMIYISWALKTLAKLWPDVISFSLVNNRPNASNTSGCSGQKGGQYLSKNWGSERNFPKSKKKIGSKSWKSQARNMEWKFWSQPWSNFKGNMEWNTFWFQSPPKVILVQVPTK